MRIRGLTVKSQDDAKQKLAEFCRKKLNVADFDGASIETVHITPIKLTSSTVSVSATITTQSTWATNEPSDLVRFWNREDCDYVWRKRKTLKGTRCSIVEGLTNLNVQTLNRVKNRAEVQSCWTWNGHSCATLKTCCKITVNPFQPIANCRIILYRLVSLVSYVFIRIFYQLT